MNDLTIIFASLFVVAFGALCFWYLRESIEIVDDFANKVTRDHAVALDRHATELAAINEALGINFQWEAADGEHVPYTLTPTKYVRYSDLADAYHKDRFSA